jgi:VanZ family protein
MFSVVPTGPRVSIGYLDKVAHLGAYLLFAWLLIQAIQTTRRGQTPTAISFSLAVSDPERAAQGSNPKREREPLLLAWVCATSYGLLIELVQGLLPWRSADVADAAMNAVGAALGVWLGERFPK